MSMVFTKEEYECLNCGRKSPITPVKPERFCPYCSIKKYLIINPRALAIGFDLTETDILVDRRKEQVYVDSNRREDEVPIPIAWIAVKKKKVTVL